MRSRMLRSGSRTTPGSKAGPGRGSTQRCHHHDSSYCLERAAHNTRIGDNRHFPFPRITFPALLTLITAKSGLILRLTAILIG